MDVKKDFIFDGNIPNNLDDSDFLFCECGILFDVNKFPPVKKGILGNKGFCFRCPVCEKNVMDVEINEGEQDE